MNLELAKNLAWYGSMISAIIGLIWIIWQMSQKQEPLPGDSEEHVYQHKFLSILWSIFFFVAAGLVIAIVIAIPKTGMRGVYFSALAGIFIPVFLASLESQVLKKISAEGAIILTKFSSLPLAGIGISLIYIGSVVFFYGINAQNLWLAFIIGTSMGLFIIKLASNLILYPRYDVMSGKFDAIFLTVNSAVAAIILASYHFPAPEIKSFLPVFILMGIFLSYLISSIPFLIKKGKTSMDVIPAHLAIFLILFLTTCLYLIVRLNIGPEYNYTIVLGAITSVIIIFLIYGSNENIKGIDLTSGTIGAVILIACLWFSFKWGLGLGIALYTLALLSVATILVPYKSIELILNEERIKQVIATEKVHQPQDEEKDLILTGEESSPHNADHLPSQAPAYIPAKTLTSMFIRAITLSGLFSLLFVMFRIFVQKSPLIQFGLDISYGDTAMALLLGVVISLSFEGFNIFGNSIFKPRKELGAGTGILLFILAVGIIKISILATGLYFRVEGLGAFLLGLTVPALLGAYVYISQKTDKGLFRASTSPLWLIASALSCFIIIYKDVPDQIPRQIKEYILIGLILVVIAGFVFIFFRNLKAQKPEVKEKDLKPKCVEPDGDCEDAG